MLLIFMKRIRDDYEGRASCLVGSNNNPSAWFLVCLYYPKSHDLYNLTFRVKKIFQSNGSLIITMVTAARIRNIIH